MNLLGTCDNIIVAYLCNTEIDDTFKYTAIDFVEQSHQFVDLIDFSETLFSTLVRHKVLQGIAFGLFDVKHFFFHAHPFSLERCLQTLHWDRTYNWIKITFIETILCFT